MHQTEKVQKEKFPDRVRFNWGYHDAVRDRSIKRQRELVESGPQTLTTVSKEYDAAYYSGYQYGLAEEEYNGSSDAAWIRHVGRN